MSEEVYAKLHGSTLLVPQTWKEGESVAVNAKSIMGLSANDHCTVGMLHEWLTASGWHGLDPIFAAIHYNDPIPSITSILYNDPIP